jgi:Zn-dependent protease with chaperone function
MMNQAEAPATANCFTIGLTDNLGKYLTKEQVMFVIAHELAHVKLKHGRKQLLLILGIYSCMAFLLFPFLISQHRQDQFLGLLSSLLENERPSTPFHPTPFGPTLLLWQNRKSVEQTYG